MGWIQTTQPETSFALDSAGPCVHHPSYLLPRCWNPAPRSGDRSSVQALFFSELHLETLPHHRTFLSFHLHTPQFQHQNRHTVTMTAPTPLPTHLYKILPSAPPTPLPARLPLSPLDAADGFIHLSTAAQTASTAAKYFADSAELWLLKIDYSTLARGTDGDGEVREGARVEWEDAGRGVFAHFYGGDLGVGNVKECRRVERGEGWEGLDIED